MIVSPKTKFFLAIVCSLVLCIGISYLFLRVAADRAKERLSELREAQKQNSYLSRRSDSLYKEATMLNAHRPLSLAMSHRDEATQHLKYAVGEAVYLKRDSTRVVITDIVIGGSAYNYYLRYRVVNRENREEEIIPELLFR